MRKIFLALIGVLAMVVVGCNKDEAENGPMHWSFDNRAPMGIKCDSAVTGEITRLMLDVNSLGGDLILSCTNYSTISLVGDVSNYKDLGWGRLAVEGRQVKCHFTEDRAGKEPQYELIRIVAHTKSGTAETQLHITRTFGQTNPDDEEEENK